MPRESIQSIQQGIEEVDPMYRPQLRKQPIKYDTYEAVQNNPEYQALLSKFVKKGEEFADKVITAVRSGSIVKPISRNAPYPSEVLALKDEFLVFAREAMKANDELPYDGVRPGPMGHRIRGMTGNFMAEIRIAMENKVNPLIIGGPNHDPVLAAWWDVITLRGNGVGGSVNWQGLLAETSFDREKRLQFNAIEFGSQVTSLAIDQLGLGRPYKTDPINVDAKVQELRDTISEVLKKAGEDNLKTDAVWGVIKQGIKKSIDDQVKYGYVKAEDAPQLLTQASALFETLK